MTSAITFFVIAFAFVFGLIIGSFLNVVIIRVPAGIPLTRESRCPSCDAPVRPWQNIPVASWLALRGRCASCGAPISPRYPLVEIAGGSSFAAITWLALARTATLDVPFLLVLLAFLYLAAISIALALIDLDTHRLPNSIVLPSYVVAAILLTVAAALSGEWSQLLRAGIGMVAMYAFYFVIRLIRPRGMGGGDVKLAGLLGLYLGWLGWGVLAVGFFAAFVLGGLFGLVLIFARRAGRKTAIPFGPWMLAGAWVGIVVGSPLGRWYFALLS